MRHLLRQYSNTLPQRPVSGLRSAGCHVWARHCLKCKSKLLFLNQLLKKRIKDAIYTGSRTDADIIGMRQHGNLSASSFHRSSQAAALGPKAYPKRKETVQDKQHCAAD